jgi:Carboxypeptidase regulatory-like domain
MRRYVGMGRVLAGLLGLLVGRAVQAQGTGLHGRVLGDGGVPVSGAQIELQPVARSVVTGDDGRFVFLALRAGGYELHVRRLGYRPVVIPLTIGTADTTVVITLTPVPAVLEAVRIREKRSELRFSAVVLDDQNQPVTDADVVAEGIDNHLRTDSSGHVIVSKVKRGTLLVRIRKLGYAAYFGSFTVSGEREDTLRMPRLATELSPVEVMAFSGFGRDTFAFNDLHDRMSWKGSTAGVVSREDLAGFGDANLCDALHRLPAERYQPPCGEYPVCILLNGDRPVLRPLSAYRASEVEALEYFPPNSDWSGTILARGAHMCYGQYRGSRGPGHSPTGFVIWLRKGVTP